MIRAFGDNIDRIEKSSQEFLHDKSRAEWTKSRLSWTKYPLWQRQDLEMHLSQVDDLEFKFWLTECENITHENGLLATLECSSMEAFAFLVPLLL
jgi:hypothetical protein